MLNQNTYAIIYQHHDDEDDYSVTQGFYLTEKEEKKIDSILENHWHEGGSSRGDMQCVLEDLGGTDFFIEKREVLKEIAESHQGHSLTFKGNCLYCNDCEEELLDFDDSTYC